jgi:hypothetical protein
MEVFLPKVQGGEYGPAAEALKKAKSMKVS